MADAEIQATPSKRGSDLGRRAVVGVVLAAVALGALWTGGIVLWMLATIVALVALIEWGGLVGADRLRLAGAIVILAVAMAYAMPMLWDTDRSTVSLLLIAALLFALAPGCAPTAWGLAYAGTASIGLLYLRELPNGLMLALWTLVIVWATDIGAYFAGRAIGGAKLAPSISPNKTWSGLIGGMAAAAIVGGLVAAGGRLPFATLWLGAPLAIVAQAGDLLESWLKRRAGVKDSGRLLPGHGGVLDRIDGALPVLILVAAINANGTF
ncbi:phosphatidate cytidylyltransferase [Sphingomonas nostoxanthinifaciens]|uniref:phosphatidate cytidylyltransferase n=1 Tax=Sphingomonas nostoxanthinifaciens TaxID=2872652 RepID=UPI001CC2086E|nr:phosphatidate cytidylyltransferase [Sphingomonas nostoxanthinifaciens]UAK25345.1 phosphatidate cytidylyltransferase [Sphingomonas nostoxanthinifaciens]